MTASEEQFFKPGKASAAKKAENTDSAAKGIVAQETAAREKKTEKLRALRLAKEAAEPAPLPNTKRKCRKDADQAGRRPPGHTCLARTIKPDGDFSAPPRLSDCDHHVRRSQVWWRGQGQGIGMTKPACDRATKKAGAKSHRPSSSSLPYQCQYIRGQKPEATRRLRAANSFQRSSAMPIAYI